MVEFPNELVDTVIDLLQSDGPALIACSRLSRQWLPRSRFHRFRSLSLVVDWDTTKSRRVERLLALVFSPLVTFVKCVKEVKLTHKWNSSFDGLAMSPREILRQLACCGIQPTHLYLDCYRHFKLPPRPKSVMSFRDKPLPPLPMEAFARPPGAGQPEARPRTVMSFNTRPPPSSGPAHNFLPDGPPAFASSLVHLEIQLENDHVSLNSIFPYICACPHLESLHIRGLPVYIDKNMDSGMSLALPPRLHTLHIAHPLISDWIISLDPVPNQITTLGLLHIHDNDWPGINRYLDSVAAKSVQSLIFSYSGRLRPHGPGPNLKNIRRLKHLSLYKLHGEGPKSLLGVLARLKSSPARQTLETITLSLRFVPGGERYSPAKWHTIDTELVDRAVWPRLRSFTILADTETSAEFDGRKGETLELTLAKLSFSAQIDIPIALSIRANLGQCDDLGILKIEGIPMVYPHEVPLCVEQGTTVRSTLGRQEITAWAAGITS
ncbi:hypothetical protein DFH08DRAFT_857436 [Mycena albidolilacea]|uniref:Uncharacterized protein n=1 Tax=Mycena albidolilacea TaxID=1033008 RepID=A0AAD7EVR5_9AGAR|nr:hypothetical protein DFH08DRAFT_857436 [Mycena albidolilacea]